MANDANAKPDRDYVDVRDGTTHASDRTVAATSHDTAGPGSIPTRHDESYEQRIVTKPAKTSAAAAFGLVFGTAALVTALTVILSPVAVVLAVVAIVLGGIGMAKAKRPGVTGRGVALGGLLLGVVALLGSLVVIAGVTTFLNDGAAVDRLENQVQQLRDRLPSDVEVPQP